MLPGVACGFIAGVIATLLVAGVLHAEARKDAAQAPPAAIAMLEAKPVDRLAELEARQALTQVELLNLREDMRKAGYKLDNQEGSE
tara:strand:- start:24161 stop:24418 length:258 start_codon:yes stop_codon:yes gene_type:complete